MGVSQRDAMASKKTSSLSAATLPPGALKTLVGADPALGRAIAQIPPYEPPGENPDGHLAALVRSIVFQQLSGKAAATIFGRLRALFPSAEFPTAAQLADKSDAELRGCGLSGQKLSYLRDLCMRVMDGRLDFADFAALADEAVIERLITVRGIGRWSAEMFLMFHLGRLDVWPIDDLGIRKGVMILHALPQLPSARELSPLGERYRPYRTVASYYLWRLTELAPAEKARIAAP